jgi:hypothetical protein
VCAGGAPFVMDVYFSQTKAEMSISSFTFKSCTLQEKEGVKGASQLAILNADRA